MKIPLRDAEHKIIYKNEVSLIDKKIESLYNLK